MHKVFYWIFPILIFSCSNLDRSGHLDSKPKKGQLKSSEYLSVLTSAENKNRKRPKIDIENKDGYPKFGPSPSEKLSLREGHINKEPIVAIALGPGLNRVLGHVAILKILKKNKVPWHIISGEGLSSLVASHLAMGKTPEKLEWLFYKFFNASKGLKPFSKKWVQKAESIFLHGIEQKRLEDLVLSALIPVYNKNKRKVHYHKKGLLTPLLKSNLYLEGFNKKRKFLTPFPWEVFNSTPFRNMGVDILIGFDVIGKKISFDRADDFLLGVFGKTLGKIEHEKGKLDLFFQLPMESMSLDSLKGSTSTLEEVRVLGEDISRSIIEHINKWKKNQLKEYEKI